MKNTTKVALVDEVIVEVFNASSARFMAAKKEQEKRIFVQNNPGKRFRAETVPYAERLRLRLLTKVTK